MSMAIFNSYVTNYQAGHPVVSWPGHMTAQREKSKHRIWWSKRHVNVQSLVINHMFLMVFQWFSIWLLDKSPFGFVDNRLLNTPNVHVS